MPTPDRWAPWIEPLVLATGTLTVTTTGYATVPGMTITLTPHIATRVLIDAVLDIESTVFAGQIIRARLNVNGTGSTPMIIWKPSAVGERLMQGAMFTIDLAKETTYTILVEAEANAAGSTFLVRVLHSRFSLFGLPNLHA